MAHMHITSWALAFILFFVAVNFYKQGKAKPGKIIHMVLRLVYLFTIFTGVMLFMDYSSISGELVIKVIAGLWVITSMEMIAVKTSKKQETKSWWIQLAIAAVIAIGLGFGRLPLGILP